jgi:hypothetical protein
MLTCTPHALEAAASISVRQSMIRGTIKKCKAIVANNNNAQHPNTKPSSQLDSLTYQRKPVGMGSGKVKESGMVGERLNQFELSQANKHGWGKPQ